MASRLDRVNRFLEGVRRERREIVTPEGVALEIELANRGERALAFVLDLFFWTMAIVFRGLVLGLLLAEKINGAVAVTLVLFAAFLLRNFYFIHFELTTQGATPGKRIVGLKVIDAAGGPLTPSAVVARNLTREVETFLPLSLFFSLETGGGDWLTRAAYLVWLALVSALPFFNRDRRRAGDFIGGTLVIAVPQRALLADLGARRATYAFTRPARRLWRLRIAGLRGAAAAAAHRQSETVLAQISERVCRRIGWQARRRRSPTRANSSHAFYVAERAHLEREQLLGRYRADKSSAPDAG